MARTNEADVQALTGSALTPMTVQIALATDLTDDVETAGLTDATRLQNIELFLAAHFVTLREQHLKSEKLGDAADSYQSGKLGMGLNSTYYGQQAIALDTTGTLATGTKPPVLIDAL